MSQQNGVSLKRAFGKAAVFCSSLLMMSGAFGSAAADYNAYCYDPCCPVDCCEMPNYVLYADFIYWQVHPEGLEYARKGGYSGNDEDPVDARGCIETPGCGFEPGFRVGAFVDLGCCNWDFYAQYTYLNSCFSKRDSVDMNFLGLAPLIDNIGGLGDINVAKGSWDSHLNVLDFGLGRTFEVNCCFDFRPHFGFKATWQDMKFHVLYEEIENTTTTNRYLIKNKVEFDGIGLRSGFDAAWRFSPCFSIVGGFAASAVYSDLCVVRESFNSTLTNGSEGAVNQNENLQYNHCALVPVLELMLGIRWDSRVCDCYDVFVFVGWENQVWWDLNRFINVAYSDSNNNYDFGPNGNITYQGLTVRAGLGF